MKFEFSWVSCTLSGNPIWDVYGHVGTVKMEVKYEISRQRRK